MEVLFGVVCAFIQCVHDNTVAQLVELWTPGSERREPGFETLLRSIYETPDWDGPVGGSSRGQLKSVEWDGPCPALMGTLNF